MLQKEIKLKNPVVLGQSESGLANETYNITLREPTAGDLRGLSLKSLIVDSKSDDWVILLSRISAPLLPIASINMMSMKDFSALIAGALEMLGEEQDKEVIQNL